MILYTYSELLEEAFIRNKATRTAN